MNDNDIARRAAHHHGVLSPALLDELDVTASQARRRVATGRWQQIHPGVYAIAGRPLTFRTRAAAALAALPMAVLSHQTASQAQGAGSTSQQLHLSVEHGTRNRLAGVVVHQATLPARHIVRRQGLPMTSIERTFVDLAAVIGAGELKSCLEEQLVERTTTLARVEMMFEELAGRGRPGTARMRQLLSRLDGLPPTESELETMFWRLVERRRLPLPLAQARFDWLLQGKGRVDFWYPEISLIVELDGRRFHQRSAAFETDRRRDQLALIRGIRTVRFSHRQLSTERDFVVEVLLSQFALERTSG